MLVKSGYFGTSSFSDEISFYVVRPWPRPLQALVAEALVAEALAVLIVDGMLSSMASTNVAIKYWSLVAAVALAIRRKLKKRKNKASGKDNDEDSDPWANVVRRSRREEPLTTTGGKFCVLYALFVLSSFVINVGN